MCYSQQTSIFAYVMGILATIYCIYNKSYSIGLFIFFYSQVQLCEFIIWNSVDNNNKPMNKFGTFLLKVVLSIELLGYSIGIILDKKNRGEEIKTTDYIPIFLSIGVFIVSLGYYMYTSTSNTTYPREMCEDRSCQNPNNRLDWKFSTNIYHLTSLLFVIFVLIYEDNLARKIILIVYFTITLILSFISVDIFSRGTIWCLSSAVLAPLLAIVYNKF